MATYGMDDIFTKVKSLTAQREQQGNAGGTSAYQPNQANPYAAYLGKAVAKSIGLPGWLTGSNGASSAPASYSGPNDPKKLLNAIKMVESGGKYNSTSPYASASGAYGMLDSTWGGYGGYKHAYLAPPEVQDAKALELLLGKLKSHNNDFRIAAQSWFYPAQAGNDNFAPGGAGNGKVTLGDYWKRILRYLS